LRRDDRGFGAAQAATESLNPGRVRHNGNCLLREGLEAAKSAEAVALEILDAEVHWLASTRATTVIGLKLKASYASKLADSIVARLMTTLPHPLLQSLDP
jgi:hypothetical protein